MKPKVDFVKKVSYDDCKKGGVHVEYFTIDNLIHGSKRFFKRGDQGEFFLIKEENYIMGVKNGTQSYWEYLDGKRFLTSQSYFKNDLMVGHHTIWCVTKNLINRDDFVEYKHYPVIERVYETDGSLRLEKNYFFDHPITKDKEEYVKFTLWDRRYVGETHYLESVTEFSKDKKSKQVTHFFRNGEIGGHSKYVLFNNEYKLHGHSYSRQEFTSLGSGIQKSYYEEGTLVDSEIIGEKEKIRKSLKSLANTIKRSKKRS